MCLFLLLFTYIEHLNQTLKTARQNTFGTGRAFYFMSIAAGGGGQLAGIKSEGCGSQLATTGLDCHLAQINRKVSHTAEPTRLSENSRISCTYKTLGKDCLLLQMLRFCQALPWLQVTSKLRPLELVSTITWRRYTHFHLERKWETV